MNSTDETLWESLNSFQKIGSVLLFISIISDMILIAPFMLHTMDQLSDTFGGSFKIDKMNNIHDIEAFANFLTFKLISITFTTTGFLLLNLSDGHPIVRLLKITNSNNIDHKNVS